MKTKLKLTNSITINIDDNFKKYIDILSDYYQRKPAELLRLLLTPVIMDQYSKMQIRTKQAINTTTTAIFKD